ncbi:MAG TPA: hypothetical protein VFN51_02670 [Candidatus Saccharimonadales bacterium]|nr:hypothetical protein [Candidatus Saccharimonadales bacterium]
MSFRNELELNRRLCATEGQDGQNLKQAVDESLELISRYAYSGLLELSVGQPQSEVGAAATVSNEVIRAMREAKILGSSVMAPNDEIMTDIALFSSAVTVEAVKKVALLRRRRGRKDN